MHTAHHSFLLTTSSSVMSEDPYEATEDFDIFSHMQFTSTLHIYTPKDKLVSSVTLPTECIDMVR